MGWVRHAKRFFFGFLLPSFLMMGVFFGQIVAVSAFDFFGLFGSDEPPNPSPSTLPYRVEFVVHGDDGVKDALQDSSNFYKLRQDPPPDGEALTQRLTADFAPMLDALWGSGYYDARIFASVGATQLELGQTEGEPVARAANAYRNRALVPVTITVETGPLFRLRNIAVATNHRDGGMRGAITGFYVGA